MAWTGSTVRAIMVNVLPLPPSDLGTYLTLGAMRAMVNREFLLPVVRLTASDVVAGIGGRDGVAQSYAIREWVEMHSEFLRDPDRVEMLHGPAWQVGRILTTGQVALDCDDIAMLTAALGKAVGLRARFVVVGFDDPRAPFRHVWAELSQRTPPMEWVEMDLTRPAQGIAVNRIRRAFAIDV